MAWETNYKNWLESIKEPEILKELQKLSNAEKEKAFYKDLEFGTGGLRGTIGLGTNRMNIFTVGRVTQGLCDSLNSQKAGGSVVIAYDSRIKSTEFAECAASVIAANGMKVYIFGTLMPTPVLSYAVRSLHCDAGIVITASHNPSAYNGYKVYGSDGCQITLDAAKMVQRYISKTNIFTDVKKEDFNKAEKSGAIEYIKDKVLNDFLIEVEKCSPNPKLIGEAGLSVVYTPLNGTGRVPVESILCRMGLKDLFVVPEQENPDGNFPTCKKPNPEERAAFECAIKLGKEKGAELLLATDPDCDRVGVAVREKNGGYSLLTGNETGCLLLNYILSQRKRNGTLPKNPVVVKTIVTSALAYKIAEAYGAQVVDTLTGFKFIGEQIGVLEKSGEDGRYVFGFEESYGSLPGTYVRDKDAVAGSMLIVEMASFYKKQGKNLLEALDGLYSRYGCFRHRLISFGFDGIDGMDKMHGIMERFRKTDFVTFAGLSICEVRDYLSSVAKNVKTGKNKPLSLPKSDVVVLSLEDGCEIVARPSGTEPKLKCYLTAKGGQTGQADEKLDMLAKDVEVFIKNKECD